jgi:hypothetical protein
MPVRVVVQHGPRDKKVAAVALDWPGWSRGAKDPGAALELLEAAWRYFDDVAARVPNELARGPRGGGRDRDQIVRHVINNERHDLAKRVGVVPTPDEVLSPKQVPVHREAFVAAMREHNAQGKLARGRNWTIALLLRHTAYHALDHAWEMEDKAP